jgi:hypothetical protein
MMDTNLLLITGVLFSAVGTAVMLVAQVALWTATRCTAVAYPRELARREIQRQDRQFGLSLVACGATLLALAAWGYSAPLNLWRFPACAAMAMILAYGIARLAATRSAAHPRTSSHKSMPRLYETARSMRLREAAQVEAANLNAIELARHPRDKGVVYLTRDVDRRWWSARFGVSADVLKAAMREVGPMTKDIERHLASRGRSREALAA